MSLNMLASAVSKTFVNPGAGSLQSANQINVPAGYAVGDIIQGSGCAQATGNKVFVITAISLNVATVTDLAGGTPVLVFAGNPAVTITHIGFVTSSLLADNTVYTSPNPDFTLRFRIESLSAQTAVRVQWQDTGDAFVSDIKFGPSFSLFGYIDKPHAQYASFESRRYDFQGLRVGNPSNALRAVVLVEGQFGGAAPSGSSVTYSAWVE